MVFKKDKEREKAVSLIREDTHKMSNFFQRLSHATNIKVHRPSLLTQHFKDLCVCLCVRVFMCVYVCACMQYTQVIEELAVLVNANQELLALDIAVSAPEIY